MIEIETTIYVIMTDSCNTYLLTKLLLNIIVRS
jgi:hypothetical protein